jgi:hypothetical protein
MLQYFSRINVAPMKIPSHISPTDQEHRHQVLWQIIVPLMVGALIVVGLGFLVGTHFNTPVDVQKWSSVALIWLLVPVFIMAFFLLITIIGMIYLVGKLLGILPPYAKIAQHAINQGKLKVEAGADAAVEPVLRLSTIWAGLRALFKRN